MVTGRAMNIKDQLYEDLKDPVYAPAYINEAIMDGDESVLKTALADVMVGGARSNAFEWGFFRSPSR